MAKKNVLKATSLSALALMLGSVAANAAVPANTIVIGNKAFSVGYLVDDKNAAEIQKALDALTDPTQIYYQLEGEAKWTNLLDDTKQLDNTGLAAVIPTVTYYDADGKTTEEKFVEAPVTQAFDITSIKAVDASGVKTALPSTTVKANSSYKVAFNAPVDTTTITTGNIFITKAGVKQLATVSYDSTKNEATLTLNTGLLDAGKDFVMTVTGIKSADGKETLSSKTFNFSTATNAVITSTKYSTAGNTIASGTLADIQNANVENIDEEIKVAFNTRMDVSTINSTTVKLYDVTDSVFVPFVINTTNVSDGTNNSMIINNGAGSGNILTATHKYQLTLKGGIADLAGNTLGSDTVYTFYCQGTGVGISSVTPGDGATAVYPKLTQYGINSPFSYKIKFNGAVDPTTVDGTTIKLYEADGEVLVDATVTYDQVTAVASIAPKADLKEATNYKVVIDGVIGTNNIKIAKTTKTFSTGDYTAPAVVSTTPVSAADSVAIDAPIVINFSEKMSSASLLLGTNVQLINVSEGNTPHAGFANWTFLLSQDGKTLTLTPTSSTKLTPNRTYQLVIKKAVADFSTTNGLAEDVKVAFNTQAAGTTTFVDVSKSTFATTATDTIKGSVVSDNAFGISRTQDLLVNFSGQLAALAQSDIDNGYIKVEKMNANGTFSAVDLNLGAAHATKVGIAKVRTGTLSTSPDAIKVYAPTGSQYDSDSTYRVVINGLKDTYGNAVQNVTRTFTVGARPSVATYKTASKVAPYVFTFTGAVAASDAEAVDNITLANANTHLASGDIVNIAGSIYRVDAVSGTNFSLSTSITAGIASGDVLKVVKSAVSGSTSNNTLSVVNPEAILTTDTFFAIVEDSNGVAKKAYNITSAAAGTVNLDQNLEAATATTDLVEYVDRTNAVDNYDTNVPVDKSLSFFVYDNNELDYNTLLTSNVKLLKNADSSEVGATVTITRLAKNLAKVKIAPAANLAAKTAYHVTFTGFADKAGNPIYDTDVRFTSGSAPLTEPKIATATPDDGTVGVAVNSPITFTFTDKITNIDYSGSSSAAYTGIYDYENGIDVYSTTATSKTNPIAVYYTSGGIDIPVLCNAMFSSDQKTLTITPKSFLPKNTVVTVVLDYHIGNTADLTTYVKNTISTSNAYTTYAFQTERVASVSPEITNADYFDLGTAGVGTGDMVVLTFNEDIPANVVGESGPVTSQNITQTMDGFVLTATSAGFTTGDWVRINDGGTNYYATVASTTAGSITLTNVVDTNGDSVAYATFAAAIDGAGSTINDVQVNESFFTTTLGSIANATVERGTNANELIITLGADTLAPGYTVIDFAAGKLIGDESGKIFSTDTLKIQKKN